MAPSDFYYSTRQHLSWTEFFVVRLSITFCLPLMQSLMFKRWRDCWHLSSSTAYSTTKRVYWSDSDLIHLVSPRFESRLSGFAYWSSSCCCFGCAAKNFRVLTAEFPTEAPLIFHQSWSSTPAAARNSAASSAAILLNFCYPGHFASWSSLGRWWAT